MSKTLHGLARKVYEEHGMSDDSVAVLMRKVISDDDLIEEVLQFACKEALRDAQFALRSSIAGTPKEKYKPKVFTEEFQKKVQDACGKWLSWPLMDGTPLSEATKEKVMENSARYTKNGLASMRNGEWLHLIATKMKDGQKVKDVYSDKELATLMTKAEKAMKSLQK